VLTGEGENFARETPWIFKNIAGTSSCLTRFHYLNDADQQLLGRIAASLAPRGVARFASPEEYNWRFAATRAEEWFVHFSRWIPMQGRNFPAREEVLRPLRARAR
jgi:hypothetical protein